MSPKVSLMSSSMISRLQGAYQVVIRQNPCWAESKGNTRGREDKEARGDRTFQVPLGSSGCLGEKERQNLALRHRLLLPQWALATGMSNWRRIPNTKPHSIVQEEIYGDLQWCPLACAMLQLLLKGWWNASLGNYSGKFFSATWTAFLFWAKQWTSIWRICRQSSRDYS